MEIQVNSIVMMQVLSIQWLNLGGPLVTTKGNGVLPGQNYYQIGVVSWGRHPCGDPNNPGVYMRHVFNQNVFYSLMFFQSNYSAILDYKSYED